ncbi:endolytic transglycosylase MltG [Streptomyces varsoviensis]|nr:endolytic transglycosylase MltG [Streptomyces varsoviensis]
MTEYGRGPEPQPWHPEDPLYGDQGYSGHQPTGAHDPHGARQDAYGGHPQQYADQSQQGQYQQYEQHHPQQYGQQQYPDQQQQYPGQPYQGQQFPGYGQQPDQRYENQQYQNQQYQVQQHGQQQYADQQQYGWDPLQGAPAQYGMNPQDPYSQPADPYGGGQQQDYYGGQGTYAQQQPQHPQQPHEGQQQYAPQQAPAPQQAQAQAQAPAPHQADQAESPLERTQTQPQVPERAEEWDAEPDGADDHPFFSGRGDGDRDKRDKRNKGPAGDDEDEEDDGDGAAGKGRKDGGDRRGKKTKRRSGMACLVVVVVLAGVVGGGGYFAYQFWQDRYGAAPDFSGEGTGEVQVDIPAGASGIAMGRVLKEKGVVKSVGAFTEAVAKNPQGKSIQGGTYTLRKEMSGAAAVALMTDPKTRNSLTIPEGRRNVQVYAAIDKKLGLKDGTTKDVAKNEAKNLGLPDWAEGDGEMKDPLEGFLFPSQYSVGKGTKPVDVLREMVSRAKSRYAKYDLEAKAKDLGLKSPLEVITVASLVQAEGMTHDDFRKMSRVVYNRLKPTNRETNGKLEFDSTYNYATNQSKINLSPAQLRAFHHPYNTYYIRGLPPGPIDNPGSDAVEAALDPEAGDWYYFVATDGKVTKFAKTLAEHDKLVQEFNANQKHKNGT